MKEEITRRIAQEKIVAIIRLKNQEAVAPAIHGLIAGGIQVLEITTNTPGFEEEIRKARAQYGHQALIGAGTITNTDLAHKALQAGAQFLVTPNTNTDIIPIAHAQQVPVLMGAFTPTEVCLAAEHGADFIKLFPAGILGIPYLKALRGPLQQTPFLVVGGITLENAQQWLNAGAAGLGIGSELTHTNGIQNDTNTIKQTALAFTKLMTSNE